MCKLYQYDYRGLYRHGCGGLAGNFFFGVVDQSIDGLYSPLLKLYVFFCLLLTCFYNLSILWFYDLTCEPNELA